MGSKPSVYRNKKWLDVDSFTSKYMFILLHLHRKNGQIAFPRNIETLEDLLLLVAKDNYLYLETNKNILDITLYSSYWGYGYGCTNKIRCSIRNALPNKVYFESPLVSDNNRNKGLGETTFVNIVKYFIWEILYMASEVDNSIYGKVYYFDSNQGYESKYECKLNINLRGINIKLLMEDINNKIKNKLDDYAVKKIGHDCYEIHSLQKKLNGINAKLGTKLTFTEREKLILELSVTTTSMDRSFKQFYNYAKLISDFCEIVRDQLVEYNNYGEYIKNKSKINQADSIYNFYCKCNDFYNQTDGPIQYFISKMIVEETISSENDSLWKEVDGVLPEVNHIPMAEARIVSE